ncbi:glycosyltransferase [Sphingomonas crusticola]|uniref:glycosyltransferase n=1 Tax=Sphingomonas crusticola TaxID=1697973 RepID=UPI0013C2F9EA|nr:glycosyltransferase [Sphingomonas crusticola]
MTSLPELLGFKRLTERARGNRARDARRWAEAAEHYRRHLAEQPDDFSIWVQLGHMLTQSGDYEEADRSYRRAAEIDGRSADLLLCWGHSRKLAGDIDRARELYAESLGIDDNAHARNELDALSLSVEAAREDAPPPPPAEQEPAHHHSPPPRRAWEARFETVKPFNVPPGGEIALFVTHSATGALKPHILTYLRALNEQDIAVLLLAVTDRQLNIRQEVIDAVAGVIVRENAGYDFAAWAHALYLHPEIYGASTLYLLNDSVAGPAAGAGFPDLIARIRGSEADLIGLTESHEYRWHFQSYFLALKPRLLSSYRLHRFFDDVRILDDKDRVIQSYELRFAEDMERSGHWLDLLFPSPMALNPTLYAWRELIADGFPFMKLLPLRGAFSEVDTEGWRHTLDQAGFDVALIDAAVRASEERLPSDGDHHLFAHPIPADTGEGRTLKVAFYGPWNYDNGLGSASRAIIGALRRCDIRLNLHPIKKPFHIHKPLAPAVDITEFGGPADIAIVHLNPDSWFLLTDEQRHAVGQARKRIGYWVWEMGHIPPAWRHDFSSVDRIWAPSRYCADLFEAQDEAAVDVIPHPVPVLPPVAVDRTAALGRLGLHAEARIILFLFDGSSYLIRKNPAALIRAFAASGLAKKGWALVLKTKHLMDRPEEGVQLAALAAGTDGVILIDRTLPADELQALWALADIYASPHCSEGFGLTIAEAMAAGKPVVATDFSGSTDYLDATNGYPVKARPWTLGEDFGHYTKGGTWARIDEPALTAALIRAAKDIGASDGRIGEAAQARIAEQLSYDRVGTLIEASLLSTMTGRGPSPRIEQLSPRPDRGTPFERADLGPDIVAVALDEAGAAGTLPDDLPTDRDRWIAFAPRGSVAAPDFAHHVAVHARHRPDVAIFYGDDVAAESDEPIDRLRLKPEFDITLLAAQDYVGAPVIVRASALVSLGGLRPETGTAVIADLLFRAHAAGMSIARIPHVLLTHSGWRIRADDTDYRMMVGSQPAFEEFDLIPGRAPNTLSTLRRFRDRPPVTLIVPTRRSALPDGSGTYVEQLLHGLAATDWPMDRLTVMIGDDIAGGPSWASQSWPFALQRIETPRAEDEPFNYAAKMNALWRAATTEQIVFMNDDIRLLEPGWLHALQSFAVDEGIGGVGARLLFDDGTLQHAGLAPHGDGAAHVWIFRRRHEGSYQGWAQTQREWSMVTGAVFATRRSLLEQVGGFDERFSLEFNDTDLCLRLRALGYRIVYTPLAEMVHIEKASRGERLPPGDDVALFLSRWKPWLDNDPAWHPNLRRDRLDMTPQPEGGAWYL